MVGTKRLMWQGRRQGAESMTSSFWKAHINILHQINHLQRLEPSQFAAMLLGDDLLARR